MAYNTLKDAIDIIVKYYGKADIWTKLTEAGYNATEALQAIFKSGRFEVFRNADGSIRAIAEKAVVGLESGGSAIDSNVPVNNNVSVFPGSSYIDGVTGKAVFESSATSSALPTIATVGEAFLAAACGIALGRSFDRALYNINPDFWNRLGLSTLDPETWKTITEGQDDFGSWLFNVVFVYDPIYDALKMMVDQIQLAYVAKKLQDVGFLEESSGIVPEQGVDLPSDLVNLPVISTGVYNGLDVQFVGHNRFGTVIRNRFYVTSTSSVRSYICRLTDEVTYYRMYIFVCSEENFELHIGNNSFNGVEYTYNGKRFYLRANTWGVFNGDYDVLDECIGTFNYFDLELKPYNVRGEYGFAPASGGGTTAKVLGLAYTLLFGEEISETFPGTTKSPGATTPRLAAAESVLHARDLLEEQFPEWWQNALHIRTIQPDGSEKDDTYITVPIPDAFPGVWPPPQPEIDPDPEPISFPLSTQPLPYIVPIPDPDPDPDPDPEKDVENKYQIKTTQRLIQKADPSDFPDTDDGDTPIPPPPGGEASSLFKVYNPSDIQLSNFGAWLWSSGFDIDSFKRLFTDPMQAIIGLHKVFVTPTTGASTQNIKVGYIDSGCPAPVVTRQYETFSCGRVSLDEYFGNCLDYAPYCSLSAFLPFIGFVNLDIADCMRGTMEIKYSVDVFTGAVLAEIKITRDLYSSTLYSFSGNCAVQYPITSGSYANMIAGGLGVAASIVGTIASDGALAPVLIGSAGKMMTTKTQVSHGGGLSPNSAAMGGKIPYLVIQRPQSVVADTMSSLQGKPGNKSIILGSCSGFLQCKDFHLDGIVATSGELSEIDSLLREGIII